MINMSLRFNQWLRLFVVDLVDTQQQLPVVCPSSSDWSELLSANIINPFLCHFLRSKLSI